MRSRASALLLAPLVALALAPTAAHAADTLSPYKAQVSAEQAADLKSQGFDVQEADVDDSNGPLKKVELIASGSQVESLAADGIDLTPLPIDPPVAKSKALGASPNPFFNVYRSYMEPGGIADELKALAAANPDVMKLEQYGTSTLGKPLYTIKMTANARNVADGTRPAILFSAVNHAREWIAAEMGRRLPVWFAEHKNDPEIARLISDRELWFIPIQNVDGYDFTFTCGTGAAQQPCDYRNPPAGKSANRFWRKTLRDNDANGVYGNNQDGVDPNRNYPSKRGIDEEGASNSFSSETYRGPYALSEPENLGIDRLQRRIGFEANINYHSAGQLLLTPVSYNTDYSPPDSTLFDAITGTDGDEAVFPYRSQHSSDLYESNGDTIDNAYMNYGIIGWTPEMDTCSTLGEPSGCNQFASPDNESKVAAVFNKNLAFALNVTNSIKNLGRPKNFDNDPSHYQVKATQDIQPNRFDVSYGGTQVVEATIRKELGDADITVNVVGQNTNITIPMTPSLAGERYGEVKGYYFERRQATIPATIGTRAIAAGDIVNVVVKAGGLQQEFRYRVEALPDVPAAGQPAKKRVLVVAAEDYTGVSPNVKPGYATAPRYLAQHVAALQAAGYEVETFNIDAPPQNGGSPNPVVRPQIKYPTYLGVLSHFDAVNYYTGDDFIPQEATDTNPRRIATATTQTGSQEMAPWSHKVMLELREYANNGGKLIVDGRNVHQTFTASGSSLSATGPYTWTPDKLFGFFYPPNNEGDDDLPGTAWQRSRGISNDTWQNYLGVVGRQSGVGVSLTNTANSANPLVTGFPVAPTAGGIFAGMAPITLDESATDDPNQNADGTPLPQPRIPLRLRNWGPSNEPLRAETVQADFATPVTYTTSGGSIISTRDAVTFSFGLEQADQASRNELVKRAMSYLVPTTADTTAPTIVGYKYPAALSTATVNDPVEVEVTAYDERGDMDYVDLKVGDTLIQRTEVYPFQFRYTPPASAIGSVVKLTAEAVDKAGNKSTRDLLLNVLDSDSRPLTPTPVNPPSLIGTPTVGSQLSCINGGFLNAPKTLTYAWLRNGAVIAGATSATYTPVAADLGLPVACRITATNAAGSGDATSGSLTISNPVPAAVAPAPSAAPAPAAAPAPIIVTKAGVAFAAACKLTASKKAISCAVSSNTTTAFTGSIRLQGHKTASTSKSGKKKVTLTVRSAKALKKGTKVVLKLKSGKTTKQITVSAS
jgi:hypothetical protein